MASLEPRGGLGIYSLTFHDRTSSSGTAKAPVGEIELAQGLWYFKVKAGSVWDNWSPGEHWEPLAYYFMVGLSVLAFLNTPIKGLVLVKGF